MTLELETIHDINQELRLFSDYKIYIEPITSSTYCVCIRNSIHDYNDRFIHRKQLKKLLDNVDTIKDFHYLLRQYARNIINIDIDK